MKIFSFLLISILLLNVCAAAQTNNAEQLAQRQALRMKDSLGLDSSLHQKVLNINRWLYQQKLVARKQFFNNDSVTVLMQRVENKRDSLYQTVLPEDKYQAYKLKKTYYISNQ